MCGKSNEILSLLRKRSDLAVESPSAQDGSSLWHEATLFERFLAEVRKDLGVVDCTDGIKRGSSDTGGRPKLLHAPVSFTDHEQLEMDPYLQLAFKEVYDIVNEEEEREGGDEVDSAAASEEAQRRRMFLLGGDLDPVLPINSVLERAFHPLVQG